MVCRELRHITAAATIRLIKTFMVLLKCFLCISDCSSNTRVGIRKYTKRIQRQGSVFSYLKSGNRWEFDISAGYHVWVTLDLFPFLSSFCWLWNPLCLPHILVWGKKQLFMVKMSLIRMSSSGPTIHRNIRIFFLIKSWLLFWGIDFDFAKKQ